MTEEQAERLIQALEAIVKKLDEIAVNTKALS